ncbi:hypothetical protein [Archangium lansingense]|uniref:Uncharacterized protein n=1 Tax=Archangium lansingense TaxID=2995310 RepID=A0ABT4AF28_9BACT|nr:hypothetical protein [Archangium lansinium]MCY1080296.1 hypothetical protein [Archangium lansinium]
MSLRDCELDVATLLQAAGVGSLAGPTPTLYAGPYPASAPDAMTSCRHSGAEKPEKYLANTGLAKHTESVTVLVRGTREPNAYTESGTRARAAWSALYDLHPPEYETVDLEDGGPTYLRDDEEQRPLWSFTVGLEYLSATAPGVVVPLSRDATLQVGGLSVTGQATLDGLLVLASMPFASFPAPGGYRGALAFDTDAGLLRVSTGSEWLAIGAPPPIPTAAEVLVTPAGELASNNVQDALEELQSDVSGRATAAELAAKADASALASHTSASTAHGVTGAVVGTTGVQTLSGKKHSGLFEVVDVPVGAVALRIPAGAYLAFDAAGTRYLHVSSNIIRSNTAFAAPSVTAGQGLGNESGAFAVDGSSNFVVTRNGRIRRLTGDTTATAGNATSNTWKGRAKVAAGQNAVTITNNLCLASSDVFAHVQQPTADANGSRVVRTTAAVGSLTIYLDTPPAADLVVAWELRD